MRVSSDGQLRLPADVLRQTGLLPDCEVEIEVDDGEIRVRKLGEEQRRREERLRIAIEALERMRGTATSGLTTDEIMQLTRGED